MRFQVGIQITLLVVAIVIAIIVVKPKIDDIRINQNEVAAYQDALLNIGRYNQQLETLVSQANSLSSTDREVLERYLPKEIDAILVASDISNIVAQNKLLLLDIIPDEVLPVTAYAEEGAVEEMVTEYDPNTGMPLDGQTSEKNDSVLMVQRFEVEVVGTYDQMKAMLNDLERNNYPLKIIELEFSLEEANSSLIQYSLLLETYALPTS